MFFEEIKDHIGEKVYLNGSGDLAFCQPYRKYLLRSEKEPRPIFTILKVTRGGKIEIIHDSGERMSVKAGNLDLVSDTILPQLNFVYGFGKEKTKMIIHGTRNLKASFFFRSC